MSRNWKLADLPPRYQEQARAQLPSTDLPALAMTEKEFQAKVITEAKARGYRAYHTFDSRHSEAGFPDLILLRDTRMIVIELKTDTGRVRPEQQAWLDAFRDITPDTYVFRPADWADILKVLT